MNLRSQKNNQEQQADETAVCAISSHVLVKTQLRGESLLGQEDAGVGVTGKATADWFRALKHGKVNR